SGSFKQILAHGSSDGLLIPGLHRELVPRVATWRELQDLRQAGRRLSQFLARCVRQRRQALAVQFDLKQWPTSFQNEPVARPALESAWFVGGNRQVQGGAAAA